MPREIILAVDINAVSEAITEAITTQEGLAAFWTPDVTASPEPGAKLRFGFEPAPVDLELMLDTVEEGRRVVWTVGDAWPHWRGTTVTWSLGDAPMEDATRVVLRHSGWADDYADDEFGSVAFTWALVLGALKGYAESGQPQPALR